jgi:hypothetical protein
VNRNRTTDPFTVCCSLFTLFTATACGTLPPLRDKIDVGRESFAVFVGGSGMSGDLYAVRANGGPVYQITFTTVAELRPALAPNGTDLAFLRGASPRDSTPASLWVMNLLNGAERELKLPKEAGQPGRIAWTSDGTALMIQAGNQLYRFDAPPARGSAQPIADEERAAAESTLSVLLGDPVFARVVPCSKRADDLCVIARSGRSGILAQAASDPVRWGTDSVGFFAGDLLQIRPLARGRPRLLHWSNAPARPRQVTFFQAAPQRDNTPP